MGGKLQALREMAQTLPANETMEAAHDASDSIRLRRFRFLKENFDKNNLIFIEISDIIYT